ncbi:hypothetical protein R1sor_007714 [Riccia sorocarpa]|uniref:Uncharacterized protein n=1 Tax=Riccia sorocarpa TaxID=122646 RepID=A0ABD3HRK2_9MARC
MIAYIGQNVLIASALRQSCGEELAKSSSVSEESDGDRSNSGHYVIDIHEHFPMFMNSTDNEHATVPLRGYVSYATDHLAMRPNSGSEESAGHRSNSDHYVIDIQEHFPVYMNGTDSEHDIVVQGSCTAEGTDNIPERPALEPAQVTKFRKRPSSNSKPVVNIAKRVKRSTMGLNQIENIRKRSTTELEEASNMAKRVKTFTLDLNLAGNIRKRPCPRFEEHGNSLKRMKTLSLKLDLKQAAIVQKRLTPRFEERGNSRRGVKTSIASLKSDFKQAANVQKRLTPRFEKRGNSRRGVKIPKSDIKRASNIRKRLTSYSGVEEACSIRLKRVKRPTLNIQQAGKFNDLNDGLVNISSMSNTFMIRRPWSPA